jgi:RNA polymerase sigma factor (sigma-70 family)
MKPEIDISVSELNNLIDEWIFSERDRKILKRRLIDGLTYERIAEEFDLSPRYVSTIIYKGIQKIAPKIPQKSKKSSVIIHENSITASC